MNCNNCNVWCAPASSWSQVGAYSHFQRGLAPAIVSISQAIKAAAQQLTAGWLLFKGFWSTYRNMKYMKYQSTVVVISLHTIVLQSGDVLNFSQALCCYGTRPFMTLREAQEVGSVNAATSGLLLSYADSSKHQVPVSPLWGYHHDANSQYSFVRMWLAIVREGIIVSYHVVQSKRPACPKSSNLYSNASDVSTSMHSRT